MKNFWALPAFLRLALASQHALSVFDDLLAYPQYEVIFSDGFVTEDEATSLLSHSSTRSSSSSTSSALPKSQETSELSRPAAPDAAHRGVAIDETYEPVVLDGQRYLCSIPTVVTPDQNSTTAPDKEEEEKELMRATERGWQLIEGMKGSCVYYLSGWWSYSFCYRDLVKQFHQLPPGRGVPHFPPTEDTNVNSFVLGRWSKEKKGETGPEGRKTLEGSKRTATGPAAGTAKDAEKPTEMKDENLVELARLESKGATRYLVQKLRGGTECDLTGKERKIEVQFHCNPQSTDRINLIKETSTCSYLMIIHTPRLCNDVAFRPPQESLAHPITCQPVIRDDEVDVWNQVRLEAAKKASLADQLEQLKQVETLALLSDDLMGIPPGDGTSKKLPVIGGIEVGAHKLVGSEGKVIEKSAVLGGGKETKLVTVASSDGPTLTAQELKKWGNIDMRDVEAYKKQLKNKAGRGEWKLLLIETPRGREFRGVIEPEKTEEEKAAEKEGGGAEKKEEKAEAKGEGKGMKKDGKVRDKESSGKGSADDGAGKHAAAPDEEDFEEGSEEIYKDEL